MDKNLIKLLGNIKSLSLDMHQASTRPCPTCLPISRSLGYWFGCYALIERTRKGTLPGMVTSQILTDKEQ